MSQAAICMAAGSLTKGALHISEKKVLCKSLSRDEIIELFEDSDYYCYSNSNYMSICSEHFAKKRLKKNSLNLKTFEQWSREDTGTERGASSPRFWICRIH